MLKHWLVGAVVLLAALLLVAPAASQDGRGVIIEANRSGTDGITTIIPTVCDVACSRIADFLFPTLFAVDPATGTLTGAAAGNYGLVVDPTLQPGNVQTFTLRTDLIWSDGTPITAYDVFFSYIPDSYNQRIPWNAQVVDASTIRFQFEQPDCSTLPRANFPVVPAHVFDADFADFVDHVNATQSGILSSDWWRENYGKTQLRTLSEHPFNLNPTATAGAFRFNALRPGQDIRLSAGNAAFVYADLPEGMSTVESFLAGDTNILINPPYNRRDDLRATPGLQIADYPGLEQDIIIFNLADPAKPKPAFDENGKPLEQGHHPLFGDVRVRRAVQLAIDVNELIETVLQGNGTPSASYLPPSSWAFNPDLPPIPFDLRAAEKLLHEAGWRDTNHDGVRECHGCLYAPEGTPLSFSLGYVSHGRRDVAAGMIARQLRRAGFGVNVTESFDKFNQRFDAFLTTFMPTPADDPDGTWQLTQTGDGLDYQQTNYGSYTNPQVETLMEQARTVPGCDLQQRAELYKQIQAIVQEDQPYAFLYICNEMVVARPGILNFDPLPGNPYWNILDWVVTP
ncbi:MAG: hypothetical protein HZC41_21110 [Chloroflexi bacterium]|nr:hypothetical protein [Chloroflexota bacterium]